MSTCSIRKLTTSDVADFRQIRLSALAKAPEAFGSVHTLEAAKPNDQFLARLTSSIVLGAYANERIVGMIGLRREDGPKDSHKAFIWGFFVEPDFRALGIGHELLSAALERARPLVEQVMLSVVKDSAAIALYERFGFVRYGVEPRALKSASGYTDEVLMALLLNA